MSPLMRRFADGVVNSHPLLNRTVAQVALQLGFEDPACFTRFFHQTRRPDADRVQDQQSECLGPRRGQQEKSA